MTTFAIGDRVRIARLPPISADVNGTCGVVVTVGVDCDDGGSTGLIRIVSSDNCIHKCEPENLDLREEPSPSTKLLSSLFSERGDEELMSKIRRFMCWQCLVGFVGIGGATGWLLAWTLRQLAAWSAQESTLGTFGWLSLACYGLNMIDGQVNGLTLQVKRWVESGGEWMLLPSPGSMMIPVACFAAAVTYAGHNPVGTWLLLVACCYYHCLGACADFDDFVDACGERERHAKAKAKAKARPTERSRAQPARNAGDQRSGSDPSAAPVQQALFEGLAPYARLGLGLGISLYAVLPLAFIAIPTIATIVVSTVGRIAGRPAAILAGAMIAMGAYLTLIGFLVDAEV